MNQTNTFWFNEVTGESSWEDPRHNTWRPVTDRETGKVFYYHPETLDSTWQPPEEVAWKEVEEEDTQHGGYGFCSPLLPLPLPRSLKDASGHLGRVPFKLRAGFLIPPPPPLLHIRSRVYYFNERSGTSTWDKPAFLGWSLHDEL